MDVVLHQTVRQHINFMHPAVAVQEFQIPSAIHVPEKHISPAISALRDVVMDSGENDPCDTRLLLEVTRNIAKRVASPFPH